MRNLFLLGAAGSIGLQALDVIETSKEVFHVIGISLGRNDEINHDIIRRTKPEIICLRDASSIKDYQERYPEIRFVWGNEGLINVASYPKQGMLLNALSGSAGLKPTVAAIESGKDILLANKETLVMAGPIIKSLIKKHKVNLYPIDSEHNALWQIIENEPKEHIEKLVITASGGALRSWSRMDLENVTIKDALKHPNWSMGAKITMDSATMMNKGLEVIEAHHLFDMPYDRIETVLHQESLVHGLVFLKDGTVKATLGPADMRIPISYALHYPKRMPYTHPQLNLTHLTFQPMDFERYPLLKLAYEVGEKGGLLPTVMNAANEAAVRLFLNEEISFTDIESIIFEAVRTCQNIPEPDLDLIIDTDHKVQKVIIDTYGKR